jgi:precorrin-6Y C5,15-methyltransferase (decarboxylating)
VVVLGPGGLPGIGFQSAGDPTARRAADGSERVLAWGLPESAFQHRGEMVTKAEVRAVALGKLELPPSGVLWDIGAGSASVSIECALLSPGLTVFAVESHGDDASRAAANASAHGVAVHVVEGRAPQVLERLPDPDRVFVGGGGIEVLDAVLERLRPGGRVVATFAALERAAAAAERLGSLVQVSAARGSRLAGGGWRLLAANPVFVAWGPES